MFSVLELQGDVTVPVVLFVTLINCRISFSVLSFVFYLSAYIYFAGQKVPVCSFFRLCIPHRKNIAKQSVWYTLVEGSDQEGGISH